MKVYIIISLNANYDIAKIHQVYTDPTDAAAYIAQRNMTGEVTLEVITRKINNLKGVEP